MSQTINLGDGKTISVETITPEQADDLLSRNDSNRGISDGTVDTYARQMESGDWEFAGDPIRISKTDRLLDGQHRLSAVVKIGKAVDFMVMRGLENDVQDVLDSGRKRSAVDTLKMHGHANGAIAAATARLLMAWATGKIMHAGFQAGNREVRTFVETHEELMARAVHVGASARTTMAVSSSVVAALYFRLAEEAEDKELVEQFFTRICLGTGVEIGDPELAFRNLVLRRKAEDIRTSRSLALYYLIRAWNARVKGERMVKLQLPRNGLTSRNYPVPMGKVGDPELPPRVATADDDSTGEAA